MPLRLARQARYQFKLDRRVLSPVQLAAITRIYGHHGAEILELLRKNPCKTVPVILARLRQKDVEWRVVSRFLAVLLLSVDCRRDFFAFSSVSVVAGCDPWSIKYIRLLARFIFRLCM